MTDEEVTYEWHPRTLADAYKEREPTRYIVDKFFHTHSLNIVYGSPGSMKSMMLADMCAHVVHGSDWLPGLDGGHGVPVDQSPVFWLDMDNGLRRTDERFAAIGRFYDLPETAPLHYISMPSPPLVAHDIDSMSLLRDSIFACGAKLVIVDNLGLITGEVEENSAMMAVIMGNLRQLAERTGIALVMIHHQRKGGAQNSRAGDALRGHSSIEASIDLALHIVRDGNSQDVTIRSTKTRGVDVPTVVARFYYEHIPGTNDLKVANFNGLPVVRGDNIIQEAIVDVLSTNGGMTKGRLVDAVHERLLGEQGMNKIRNWIDEMVGVTGELEMETGKYNAKIISLS